LFATALWAPETLAQLPEMGNSINGLTGLAAWTTVCPPDRDSSPRENITL
jgi:hypothetical protein